MRASRILLATDFTETSAGAEAWVEDVAARLRSHIVVLHAVEPIPGGDRQTEAFLAILTKKAQVQLAQREDRMRQAGLSVEVRVLTEARWRAIVQTAEREACDLIVLGANRLIHDGHPILGSTSHKVFLAARSPVLFVPNRE